MRMSPLGFHTMTMGLAQRLPPGGTFSMMPCLIMAFSFLLLEGADVLVMDVRQSMKVEHPFLIIHTSLKILEASNPVPSFSQRQQTFLYRPADVPEIMLVVYM